MYIYISSPDVSFYLFIYLFLLETILETMLVLMYESKKIIIYTEVLSAMSTHAGWPSLCRLPKVDGRSPKKLGISS